MSERWQLVAETAQAYCAVVMEETATQQELEHGGLWVSRMVEVRERRRLAYAELAHALRVSGLLLPMPDLDVSDRAYRRRWTIYAAEETAARVLDQIRAIAAGTWPPAYPAPPLGEKP